MSRYATFLIPTKKERVQRFVKGFNYNIRFGIAREVETEITFHQVVEIARRLLHIHRQVREDREGKKPHGTRGFSGAHFWEKGHYGRGHLGRPFQQLAMGSRVLI